jgi:hypothetical protein
MMTVAENVLRFTTLGILVEITITQGIECRSTGEIE